MRLVLTLLTLLLCIDMIIGLPGASVVGNRLAGATIPTEDLILYLDPSNAASYSGTGTDWTDLSSAGNDATLSGIDYSTDNGGIMVLDAVADYAPVTLNTELSSTAYTKCAWVNFGSFTNFNNILSGGNNAQHAFWTINTTKINAGHNGNYTAIVSDTVLSIDTWYFVTLTFSTTNGMKIYIDGALDKSEPTVTTAFNTGTPEMLNVARFDTGANGMVGKIGLVLAYNREITADEVTSIYDITKGRFL